MTRFLPLASLFLAALAVPVHAQDWPGKPVKLIVAYPPGGAVDNVGRMLAEKLSVSLGQAVVVENKAGAGGLIGADAVAKGAPDGYTFVLGTVSSHAIAPSVYKKMPYDPVADFAPVSLVAPTPYFITVNPSVPAKTLAVFLLPELDHSPL